MKVFKFFKNFFSSQPFIQKNLWLNLKMLLKNQQKMEKQEKLWLKEVEETKKHSHASKRLSRIPQKEKRVGSFVSSILNLCPARLPCNGKITSTRSTGHGCHQNVVISRDKVVWNDNKFTINLFHFQSK